MHQPAISVILPAYNCQEFLARAIESILNQTFENFELLVINDGSTDGTEDIIRSFKDGRIRYLKNEVNSGLIFTLNRGIQEAKGEFIARMDADDICFSTRFEKQFNWLNAHPETSVVGSHILIIDEKDNENGNWKLDQETVHPSSIKAEMAWKNCLAHPTVMMRSEVAKKYMYNPKQKNIEDYDLWLRLLADGHIIEKVPENLLKYRVHNTSVTGSILRKGNPYFIQYKAKRKFLANRIKNFKWGSFETKVLFTTISDGILGIGKTIKQFLKR